MNQSRILPEVLFITFVAVIFSSCGTKFLQIPPETVIDGKYDIAFPFTSNSPALEEMLSSVRLLNASARYYNYLFDLSDSLTASDLKSSAFKKQAAQRFTTTDYLVGSATLIYHQYNKIAVLTCAHVVDYPDTAVRYFQDEFGNFTEYIREVSIKKSQLNTLSDIREGEEMEILAMDQDLDIAILGKSLRYGYELPLPVFRYPVGRAQELTWGTFVYVIGFPSGKKMITRGIVSNPNRTKDHSFLVDAIFNRGFSGGIVVAMRDGVPNFELVGMVNASAAESEWVLVPETPRSPERIDADTPYEGNIYLQERKKLIYGICFGISIESISKFIQRSEDKFRSKGYNIDKFFR